jgi:hypothetical protein
MSNMPENNSSTLAEALEKVVDVLLSHLEHPPAWPGVFGSGGMAAGDGGAAEFVTQRSIEELLQLQQGLKAQSFLAPSTGRQSPYALLPRDPLSLRPESPSAANGFDEAIDDHNELFDAYFGAMFRRDVYGATGAMGQDLPLAATAGSEQETTPLVQSLVAPSLTDAAASGPENLLTDLIARPSADGDQALAPLLCAPSASAPIAVNLLAATPPVAQDAVEIAAPSTAPAAIGSAGAPETHLVWTRNADGNYSFVQTSDMPSASAPNTWKPTEPAPPAGQAAGDAGAEPTLSTHEANSSQPLTAQQWRDKASQIEAGGDKALAEQYRQAARRAESGSPFEFDRPEQRPRNVTPQSPSWEFAETFGSTLAGEISGGGKALVTGEAGTALGNRAVGIVEGQTGTPFTGSASDWGRFGRGVAGDLVGFNPTVEAAGGYDIATSKELDAWERGRRGAAGIAALSGTAAAGISAAARVAGAAEGTAAGAGAGETAETGRVAAEAGETAAGATARSGNLVGKMSTVEQAAGAAEGTAGPSANVEDAAQAAKTAAGTGEVAGVADAAGATSLPGNSADGASSPPQLAVPNTTKGVDLELYYKPDWTEAQRAAAKAKCDALTEAETIVVKSPQRAGTSAAARYRQAGNAIPAGSDVDHVVDMQLSGADNILNMNPLDASVNRSLGAQVQQRIQTLPPGTRVNQVTITDR